MTEITVTSEQTGPRKCRYVARAAGIDAEADLTFTQRGEERINADHTGAPPALRGTGAAGALVRRMVQDARETGFAIIPPCDYVQAQQARHPGWADVFTTAPDEKPDPQGWPATTAAGPSICGKAVRQGCAFTDWTRNRR